MRHDPNGPNRWGNGTHCAASTCGEPLHMRPGDPDYEPVRFGGQHMHRVCARRHRRWLAKRRDRIAREERDCA